MPIDIQREKVFFKWIFFILINFFFYLFAFSFLFGACSYPEPLGTTIVIIATLFFFLINFKYFSSISKLKKILVILGIVIIVFFLTAFSRMNVSCSRGSDAAIKASMANMRALGELYWDSNNSYEGFCETPEVVTVLTNVANLAKVFLKESTPAACHDSPTAWAAISVIKNPKTLGAGFCVDSTDAARESTYLPAGVTVCP